MRRRSIAGRAPRNAISSITTVPNGIATMVRQSTWDSSTSARSSSNSARRGGHRHRHHVDRQHADRDHGAPTQSVGEPPRRQPQVIGAAAVAAHRQRHQRDRHRQVPRDVGPVGQHLVRHHVGDRERGQHGHERPVACDVVPARGSRPRRTPRRRRRQAGPRHSRAARYRSAGARPGRPTTRPAVRSTGRVGVGAGSRTGQIEDGALRLTARPSAARVASKATMSIRSSAAARVRCRASLIRRIIFMQIRSTGVGST